MANWSRAFFDPITLPDGRSLRTLREAADYITALPPREHDRPHWLAAIEALILEAECGEPGVDPMMARIAMVRALHADRPKAAPGPRRRLAKAYRIVT